MNTLIIAHDQQSSNTAAGKKLKRTIYTLIASKKKRGVIKATSKQRVLGLRGRRVANGPLFNNDSLTVQPPSSQWISDQPDGTLQQVTVGLLWRGAERKHQVQVVWKTDHRGNPRRYITQADFLLLPRELQHVAKINGVNIKGALIIFSRCAAAWAGLNVKGMHVHHVNMDTTDDRLANLWVLTPKEHAAVHADKDDLVYDEEWYEYSPNNVLCMRMTPITDDDIAVDIVEKPPLPHGGAVHTLEMEYFADGGNWWELEDDDPFA